MQRFAFIIHPIDARRDVARKYPLARYLPESVLEQFIKTRDPMAVSAVTGVKSKTGEELEGWLIACPLTPHQFVTLPLEFVYHRLEQCGQIAIELGAGIIGLGAFTSVVGDGGITLASRLKGIAVTTGNSYTVATAIQGAVKAAELMGVALRDASVAVVGAGGSIGATCAEILSADAASMSLVGRGLPALEATANRIASKSRASVRMFTDVAEGLREADIVITVTSAVDAVILPEHIKSGAVVCDVARPRDVSTRVAAERNDVLVIEGGVVRVPGEMRLPKFGNPNEQFSFGFEPGTAYACMSETMMLALEGRYENFTLGKEVTARQVEEIGMMASRHGFELEGFRSFEKAVTAQHIENVKKAAHRNRIASPRAEPQTLPR